jgi:hypothetical protein
VSFDRERERERVVVVAVVFATNIFGIRIFFQTDVPTFSEVFGWCDGPPFYTKVEVLKNITPAAISQSINTHSCWTPVLLEPYP